jgi:hypothetical protein
MNAFYISLLTMKSAIAFGTVKDSSCSCYGRKYFMLWEEELDLNVL